MRVLWPWLTLIGLGMYHGVNPAMGWLFAAALGLHRGRRFVVVQSLVPIAIGHLLSIAVAVEMVLVLGVFIDRRPLLMVAGGGLILWALYHLAYGCRHLRRIGMQAGLAGLLPYGERARRWAHAGPFGVSAVLFGWRGARRDRCRRNNHPARCGRRPHDSHGNRQRDHRDCSLRLDRGRIPAARMDKL